MKIVVQRVKEASVSIEEQIVASIGAGLLLLVGVEDADTKADIDYAVRKLVNMRIFSDENDKMNLSVKDIDGGILSVSQFTLFAETRKGNRPSFNKAGAPAYAEKMYDIFNQELSKVLAKPISQGEFGADMAVSLVNDGPVTIILDTSESRE